MQRVAVAAQPVEQCLVRLRLRRHADVGLAVGNRMRGRRAVFRLADWAAEAAVAAREGGRQQGDQRLVGDGIADAVLDQHHGALAGALVEGIADADLGLYPALWRQRLVGSEAHTSELQSLTRRTDYVVCLKKKNTTNS